ncbi:MAG TPA: hypothetical protein EYQ31_15285 [Candidatus Handelsmanbacteria bacterium]|nr:hypothetical protein [Candidatus Handelsmanbacteria bacterium]
MLHVEALAVSDGVVFGATPGGVLRYDPDTGSYRRFTRTDGLAGNHVLSVLLDSTGDLWFGTDGTGVSRLRASEARFEDPVRALDGLTINCMTALQPDDCRRGQIICWHRDRYQCPAEDKRTHQGDVPATGELSPRYRGARSGDSRWSPLGGDTVGRRQCAVG